MSAPENPPAFPPHPGTFIEGGDGKPELWHGMTLRDWFAGQGLAGLLATDQDFHDEEGDGWGWHARAAYSMADAMLAERAKGGAS